MTAINKILANRANARFSSGPRTLEGKAVSKMNALRTGLSAKDIVVPGEWIEDWEAFRTEVVTSWLPVNAVETELAEQIAASVLRRTA